MKLIRWVDDILAMLEKGVILICFWLLVALVIFNILSRNVFHVPSHRIFEAGPQLVLWLALFGATLALKHERHIRLELVMRHFGDRVRLWAAVIVNLFGALVMILLLLTSFEFVLNEVGMFGTWGWMAVVFPVFFTIAAFRYLTTAIYQLGQGPQAHPDATRRTLYPR